MPPQPRSAVSGLDAQSMQEVSTLKVSLSQCSNMSDIRAAVAKEPSLRDAFVDSLQPMKALLSGIFSRLSLKKEPFHVLSSANDQSKDELFEALSAIDPNIKRADHLASVISQRPQLQAFMEHYCVSCHYFFSIKKCGAPGCTICLPLRLSCEVFDILHHLPDPEPDASGDYYKPFHAVYGTEMTE